MGGRWRWHRLHRRQRGLTLLNDYGVLNSYIMGLLSTHLSVRWTRFLVLLSKGEKQRCPENQEVTRLPWEDQPHGELSVEIIVPRTSYQRLINARSFTKADGYAVKAKDGEVEHGNTDSSEAKPMLGKELESSNWVKGRFAEQVFPTRNLCVLPSCKAPLGTSLFRLK